MARLLALAFLAMLVIAGCASGENEAAVKDQLAKESSDRAATPGAATGGGQFDRQSDKN